MCLHLEKRPKTHKTLDDEYTFSCNGEREKKHSFNVCGS